MRFSGLLGNGRDNGVKVIGSLSVLAKEGEYKGAWVQGGAVMLRLKWWTVGACLRVVDGGDDVVCERMVDLGGS